MARDKYYLYFIFTKVCEYRSYSRVAKVMGYTCHQTVSERMRELAKILGAEALFTCHSRGVTPTPAALQLYEHIKEALDAIDVAEVEFRNTHNLPQAPRPQPTKLCPACANILTALF